MYITGKECNQQNPHCKKRYIQNNQPGFQLLKLQGESKTYRFKKSK